MQKPKSFFSKRQQTKPRQINENNKIEQPVSNPYKGKDTKDKQTEILQSKER
jgi:hypothetical protein